MVQDKIKQEVSLDKETFKLLSILAEKEGQDISDYMEHVLKDKANSLELTDDYKAMMDEMLRKHDAGELNYTPWEEVKKRIRRR
jgi:predicted transcriptional regulator